MCFYVDSFSGARRLAALIERVVGPFTAFVSCCALPSWIITSSCGGSFAVHVPVSIALAAATSPLKYVHTYVRFSFRIFRFISHLSYATLSHVLHSNHSIEIDCVGEQLCALLWRSPPMFAVSFGRAAYRKVALPQQ